MYDNYDNKENEMYNLDDIALTSMNPDTVTEEPVVEGGTTRASPKPPFNTVDEELNEIVTDILNKNLIHDKNIATTS